MNTTELKTTSSSKFLSRALAQKVQQSRVRRRGINSKRGVLLTMVDPETPRASGPLIRSPLEIKELRKKLGLSCDNFSKALNIHPDTVRKYEATSPKTNRFPSMASFRLMEFLERKPELIQDLGEPPYFSSSAIKQIRKELGVSQSVFANLLGQNASAIAAWEQAQRHPCGPAVRLLMIALLYPDEIIPEFYG